MVFNRPNYPLLSALFQHLGTPTYPTDMPFAASIDDGRLEYAGTYLGSLFGQRRNVLRAEFWGLLASVLRFSRCATRALHQPSSPQLTLGEFLDGEGFDQAFRDNYLYPMAAAIWSSPHARADRSRAAVTLIFADGSRAVFDEVVLAGHSDQALNMLGRPSPDERRLLAAIPYQSNRVLLHRDSALMPRQRRVWSSWNYLSDTTDTKRTVSVTYWMDSLQQLPTANNYFVSLNPSREPRAESIVDQFEYAHPMLDAEALLGQQQLHRLQGQSGTWFAGAWTGYGFHEDGIRSAVEVAAALGARVPWLDETQASRSQSCHGPAAYTAAGEAGRMTAATDHLCVYRSDNQGTGSHPLARAQALGQGRAFAP